MDSLLSMHALIAFVTLCVLELVLGIDNIIFISIVTGQLPKKERRRARTIGLLLAIVTRIALLLSLTWIMSLTSPLFSILGKTISGRDVIVIGGGLFLISKSTWEIHQKMEPRRTSGRRISWHRGFFGTIVQILLLDLIFSLDSVITAIGMANQLVIMMAAIVIATLIMMAASHSIADFVDRHPTIKVLALSFLVLIGVALIGEGFDTHIPKGYIYFSMAYALIVEILNIRMRGKLSKKKKR